MLSASWLMGALCTRNGQKLRLNAFDDSKGETGHHRWTHTLLVGWLQHGCFAIYVRGGYKLGILRRPPHEEGPGSPYIADVRHWSGVLVVPGLVQGYEGAQAPWEKNPPTDRTLKQ